MHSAYMIRRCIPQILKCRNKPQVLDVGLCLHKKQTGLRSVFTQLLRRHDGSYCCLISLISGSGWVNITEWGEKLIVLVLIWYNLISNKTKIISNYSVQTFCFLLLELLVNQGTKKNAQPSAFNKGTDLFVEWSKRR